MPSKAFRSPKSMEAKASSSGTKTEYACDKCNKKFDNKISSAEHKLTHLKQITLKLERVNIDSEEKQERKVDLQEDETKETETRSSRTVSIDKHGDDPSEEIGLSVEDDTDDEEIISSKSKTEIEEKSKRDENEKSSKADAVEKLDMTENESENRTENSQRTEEEEEEEFTKPQDNKDIAIKETEQDPTTMLSDKLITPNETEQKDTDDKDDSKDQEIVEIDEVQNISKDKDVTEAIVILAGDNQETEKCEKIKVENDADILTKEEEKQSIDKCNNDAENVEETTTTCNDETLVNNATKNQDEDLANETQSRNSVDEKTEENVKTAEDDLENESRKKSDDEKDRKSTLDIINRTKTSNDKKHLDEITIADEIEITVSKQQNGDIMINTIVDKFNSTEDVKSDLLNCEKLDEAVDDPKDENDVTIAPLINNNDVTEAKLIEERDDNPKNKDRLDDTINSLENLIKETIANEEYEMQENSNHAATSNSPADAANEILSEVFDLAAAEVQKREDKVVKTLDDIEMETLENISREIHNSADIPSLNSISVVELDDDNGITLD